MKTEIVHALTASFEAHAQQTEGGTEYWLARDLQRLLGYNEWRNFNYVISKARTACDLSGHKPADHFVDVNKLVDLGSGSQRQIDDLLLTRYACYLIAQSGDPRLAGVLPKTYNLLSSTLLKERLKKVSAIPASLNHDAFGRIHEYFLGKFAMSESRGGQPHERHAHS